jgi:hypothetical protein
MQVYVRAGLPERAQQVKVVAYRKSRVESALNCYFGYGVLTVIPHNFLYGSVNAVRIGVARISFAAKGAEGAVQGADVGEVEIQIDDVGCARPDQRLLAYMGSRENVLPCCRVCCSQQQSGLMRR